MKRITMALVPLTVFLVGCGTQDTVEHGGVDGEVEKVIVDGTTCVVYDGIRAGGISCDWGTP